jgi:hypothetical protein
LCALRVRAPVTPFTALSHVPAPPAGVYLPMLAERLLKHYPDVPLAGLAAGNGCWGNKVGLCSDSGDSMTIATSFFHAHDMFDDRLWDDMQQHCDWYNVTEVPPPPRPTPHVACVCLA